MLALQLLLALLPFACIHASEDVLQKILAFPRDSTLKAIADLPSVTFEDVKYEELIVAFRAFDDLLENLQTTPLEESLPRMPKFMLENILEHAQVACSPPPNNASDLSDADDPLANSDDDPADDPSLANGENSEVESGDAMEEEDEEESIPIQQNETDVIVETLKEDDAINLDQSSEEAESEADPEESNPGGKQESPEVSQATPDPDETLPPTQLESELVQETVISDVKPESLKTIQDPDESATNVVMIINEDVEGEAACTIAVMPPSMPTVNSEIDPEVANHEGQPNIAEVTAQSISNPEASQETKENLPKGNLNSHQEAANLVVMPNETPSQDITEIPKPEEKTQSYTKAALSSALNGVQAALPYVGWKLKTGLSKLSGVHAALPYVGRGLQTGWSKGCELGYNIGYWGWLTAKGAVNIAARIPKPSIPARFYSTSATKKEKAPKTPIPKVKPSNDAQQVKPKEDDKKDMPVPKAKNEKVIPASKAKAKATIKRANPKRSRSLFDPLWNSVNYLGSFFGGRRPTRVPKKKTGLPKKKSAGPPQPKILSGLPFEIPPELRWLEEVRLELLSAFSETVDIHQIRDFDQVEGIAKALASTFGYVMELKYALEGSSALAESDLKPDSRQLAKSAEYQALKKEYLQAPSNPPADRTSKELITNIWGKFFGEAFLSEIFPKKTLKKIRHLSDQLTDDQVDSIQKLLTGTNINEIFRYLIPLNPPIKANIFSQTAIENPWNTTNSHVIFRLAALSRNKVRQQTRSFQGITNNRSKMQVFKNNQHTPNVNCIPALINRALEVDNGFLYESFHKGYLYDMSVKNYRTHSVQIGCTIFEKFDTAKNFMRHLLLQKLELTDKDLDDVANQIPSAVGLYREVLGIYHEMNKLALQTRRMDEKALIAKIEEAKKEIKVPLKEDVVIPDQILMSVLRTKFDSLDISAEEMAKQIKGISK